MKKIIPVTRAQLNQHKQASVQKHTLKSNKDKLCTGEIILCTDFSCNNEKKNKHPATHLHILHVHRMEADQPIVIHHLAQRAAHAVKLLLQLAPPTRLRGRLAFFPLRLVTSHLLLLPRAGLGGGDIGNLGVQIPARMVITHR